MSGDDEYIILRNVKFSWHAEKSFLTVEGQKDKSTISTNFDDLREGCADESGFAQQRASDMDVFGELKNMLVSDDHTKPSYADLRVE